MIYRCKNCQRYYDPKTQFWRKNEPPEWEIIVPALCFDCHEDDRRISLENRNLKYKEIRESFEDEEAVFGEA